MKLKRQKTVVVSGQVTEEIGKYAICEDSMDIIFEILRSKMYASPIRAIMQEVSSNARDANREAGRGDVPIEIKMPNRLDPTFYIRDFGIGITRERMAQVFLKYGGSTKRDSNDQTGGFGLGAKTPFSYSDSFSIVTVTDENGDGVLTKQTYVACIEETRRGKIDLVNSVPAEEDDKQGTTIILQCNPGDEGTFKKWLMNTCRYWKVKPNVLGLDGGFKWEDYKVMFEGNNWRIFDRKENHYGHYDSQFSKPYALVDGIPYEIKSDYVFGGHAMEGNMSNLLGFPLRLDFNIGEIELSSTREDIQYTKTTINRIKVRLEAVLEELTKIMKASIAKCSDLWEAKLEWYKLSNVQSSILKECEWKGIKVARKAPNVTRKYPGISMKRFKRQKNKAPSMQTVYGWEYMNEDAIILVNDTGSKLPQKSRITTLLNDNDDINLVYAITVDQSYTNGHDPSNPAYEDGQTQFDALYKKYHLDKMGTKGVYKDKVDDKGNVITDKTGKALREPVLDSKGEHKREVGIILLSDIEPYKTPKMPRVKGASVPVAVKRYSTGGYGSSFNSSWNEVSSGDVKLSDKGRVYVVLYNRNVYLPKSFDLSTKKGRCVYGTSLEQAVKKMGCDLYGVPIRFVKKLGKGWIPLEDHLQKKVDQIKSSSSFKGMLDEVDFTSYSLNNKFFHFATRVSGSKFLSLLDNTSSTMYQYVELSRKVEKGEDQRDDLNAFNRILIDDNDGDGKKKSKSKLMTLFNKIETEYPLIKSLDDWSVRHMPIEELAFYFNAKDKANKV